MIMLLGGTADSVAMAQALVGSGHRVLYLCVTELLADKLRHESIELLTGQTNHEELTALIRQRRLSAVVDATHPYAKIISENARQACTDTACPYIRLTRSVSRLPKDAVCFNTQEEAAFYLAQMSSNENGDKKTGRILLTTGSKQLELWQNVDKERLVIRVLPTSGVLEKCERLGYKPSQILAVQGPFSMEQDFLTLTEKKISYLVTKDAGETGGTPAKFRAAEKAGVIPIVILRPKYEDDHTAGSVDEVLTFINKQNEG